MIREAINNLIKYRRVDELSENAKREFFKEIADSNLVRGKFVFLFLILVEFIIIIVSMIKDRGDVFTAPKVYYYIMYLVFIVVMSCALVIVNTISKKEVFNVKNFMVFTYLFVAFVIVWNMFISLLDQKTSGSLLPYFTTLIASSVIAYIKPKALIIIYAFIQASFLLLFPFFLPEGVSPFAGYVNTSIAVLISFFLGYILYQNKTNDFVQRKIIEQKNEQLRLLNDKLVETNKTLEYLSQTDGLTGIYNRRKFNELSQCYWNICLQKNTSLSVIMMDIDHFKEYNDNFGHQAGDDCLIKLVECLKHTMETYTGKKDSVLSRYGGEEFILMICDLSEEDSIDLAERIRKNIEDLKIERKYKIVADHITLSLGLYRGVPAGDSSSLLDYIGYADKALYEAKKALRNNTKIYYR